MWTFTYPRTVTGFNMSNPYAEPLYGRWDKIPDGEDYDFAIPRSFVMCIGVCGEKLYLRRDNSDDLFLVIFPHD